MSELQTQVYRRHLGAIFRPQNPPEDFIRAAKAAESAGLPELWVWEDCFLEGGLTSAAAMLGATERLTIGLGLIPVPLRNVAVLAMELATLQRMFPGRLRVGVGHGVQDWMGQVGARVTSPLSLMREYVTALKRLLNGDTVSMKRDYITLNEVALDWPPSERMPILVGAIGPKTLQLAGELADGVLLDADLTVSAAEEALTICHQARKDAGVSDEFDAVMYQRYYRGIDASSELRREVKEGGLEAALTEDSGVTERIDELVAVGFQTVVLLPSANDPDPIEFLAHVTKL